MVIWPQEENQEGKGYRLSTVAREDVRIHSHKDFKEAVETGGIRTSYKGNHHRCKDFESTASWCV